MDVLDLRVLVDTTSVEAFAAGGTVVVTEQIFPGPTSTGLSLRAVDGVAVMRLLEVHAMEDPSENA